MDKTCPCGKIFFVKPYLLHRKKYCCKICFYKYHGRKSGLKYILKKVNPTSFKKGQKPWNAGLGKGWIDEGYKKIRISGECKREHRELMEDFLGRKLEKDEVVHHKNGNKLDNRIINLQVLTISEHIKLHHQWRKKINKQKGF